MVDIFDVMYTKRFYLPKNSYCCNFKEINAIGQEYKHACCVYISGKGTMGKNNYLSYGDNTNSSKYDFIANDHAEICALKKLKPRSGTKKLRGLDLVVVKVNKSGKILNSKPCADCLKKMSIIACKFGYYINRIFYSTAEGEIVKTNIRKLKKETQYVSSYFLWQKKSINM